MYIWLDVLIAILIVFLTIVPFIWDGKTRNYILIAKSGPNRTANPVEVEH